jgi:hypothetical protein
MKSALVLLAFCFIAACARNSSLLDPEQQRLVDKDLTYLDVHLANVYSQIGSSRSNGALIAIPSDRLAAPQVIIRKRPEGALFGVPSDSRPTGLLTCYYVYPKEQAIEPLRGPCKDWVDEAERLEAIQAENKILGEGQTAIAAVLKPLLAASQMNTAQILSLTKQVDVLSHSYDQSVSIQATTSSSLIKTLTAIDNNNQVLNNRLNELAAQFGKLK